MPQFGRGMSATATNDPGELGDERVRRHLMRIGRIVQYVDRRNDERGRVRSLRAEQIKSFKAEVEQRRKQLAMLGIEDAEVGDYRLAEIEERLNLRRGGRTK